MFHIKSLSLKLSLMVIANLILLLLFLLADKFYFNLGSSEYLVIIIFFVIVAFMMVRYIQDKLKSLEILAKDVKNINEFKAEFIKPKDDYIELFYVSDVINKLIGFIKEDQSQINHINKTLLKIKKELHDSQRIAKMASWIYYPDSKKFEASKELYRMFEMNAKRNVVDVETFINMVHIDEKKHFINMINSSIVNGSSFEYIHKIITKKGRLRYIKTVGKTKRKKRDDAKLVAISLDITEEMRAKMEAEYIAYHDPLTSLLNRRGFLDKLEFLTILSRRDKKNYALVLIDIDNFKNINDSYGHLIGDKLLVEIANILKSILRKSDIVGRIGSDEFLVALNGINNKDNVLSVIGKIKGTICKRFEIDKELFFVSLSIGVAMFPDDSGDEKQLISYADASMQEAKRRGRNGFYFFDDKVKEKLKKSTSVIGDLERAFVNEEIVLYFQPQIDLNSGEIRGAEVLSRWSHPSRGFLYPGEYLSIVESTPLMLKYDEYIIKKSFEQLYRWQRDGFMISLSLNLSAMEFSNSGFLNMIKDLLKKYPIDTKYLEFEITETIELVDMGKSIMILQNLKNFGFNIALDDFGTGYSSLSYLRRLPFDVLKIDREFIKDIESNFDDVIIVKLIIKIANLLNKKVVAEGIENKEQEELLRGLGCEFAQGFYYSQAINSEEFEIFAKSRKGLKWK